MSDELVITNNVIVYFEPPGWFDGLYGFWWNLRHLMPWLPNDEREWVMFGLYYLAAAIVIQAIRSANAKDTTP